MTATSARHIDVPEDPEELQRLSAAEGWGDGAPLVPPTPERIAARLSEVEDPPERVIGELPPRFGAATVELVAANAAMAGCAPEAFPYVIAALEAILAPDWNAMGLTTTTSSVFPMLIVNGPRRDELGIDYGAGCLGGAGGIGSMTIGRAVSLCLRNIGGQRVGETSRSVFGQPARFGMCFGEWEERSPWPSLAEREGFERSDEVVTVHGGKGVFPMADVNNDDPKDLAYMIAKCISFPLNNWYLEVTGESGQLVYLINPMWAERLGRHFPAVSDLQEYVWEHAWQHVGLFTEANARVLDSNNRVDEEGRVRLYSRPEQFMPVVCGGLGNLHGVALTTFVQSEMQAVRVRRRSAPTT